MPCFAHGLLTTFAFVAALSAVLPADAGEFVKRKLPPGANPDSRARSYQVYLPDGLDERETPPPVVMVLHGCRQTEQNMIDETRFVELADRENFVAVFPFVTSYDELRIENCWGFWFPQHRQEGRGEAADLRRILDQVESVFETDPQRRYVAGLSSGAAMSVVMAVAYSEDIAAVGSVAGLPYGEDAAAVGFACGLPTTHHSVSRIVDDMQAEQDDPVEQRQVPMMVIHSQNDCTVPIRNGLNIRDSWIRHYAADPDPVMAEDCTTEGVTCRHNRYAEPDGATVVETVLYNGPTSGRTHYWVGDNAGPFADPNGQSATELLWSFFQDKTLTPETAAKLRITETNVDGRDITVAGTAEPGDSEISVVRVRLDGAMPQPEQDTQGTTAWTTTFESVPDNERYMPVARLILEDGAETVAYGPQLDVGVVVRIVVEKGSWQQHLAAGRLALQGSECPMSGTFGACDTDFTTLFFQHQFAPFPLYAADPSGPWYAAKDNVAAPDQGRADR